MAEALFEPTKAPPEQADTGANRGTGAGIAACRTEQGASAGAEGGTDRRRANRIIGFGMLLASRIAEL
jgi:hypothetical protein